MIRVVVASALAIVALRLPALAADPGDLVKRAAVAYAEQTSGSVAFRVVTHTDLHAAMIHRTEDSETLYVESGDAPVRKKVLRDVENGKAHSDRDLDAKSREVEGPLSRFGMALPSDPKHLGEYTFDAPSVAGATTTLAFHTKVKDQAHGDGTMTLAGTKIARIEFAPAVLPEHATAAHLAIVFDQVAPQRWDITRIERHFTGRQGFLSGSADSVSTYSGYRVYPTVDNAVASLLRESAGSATAEDR